ncbi:MAG: hypothetical protein LW860_14385 [Xanthomonadaceae bacterium]|jgi:hypothetical protein|nr:hypothetical protein [Xanthomonadaceae bacterium]
MLSQGDTFSAIDLLELPYARRLEIDTAEHARALQRKSKAAFVLYGRLRCRDAGTRIWRLDIRGLVSHGEIGHNNQKRLEREFSELLPRKKELPDHSALPEFELLSAVVDLVSRYVIAIAINVSGDPRRASSLFQTVADACSNQDLTTEPVITSIRDRLPIRFYEVFTWAAQLELRNWLNTRDEKRIAEATIQLERVPTSERHRPDYLGTLALCKFVASRDLRGAEALLKSPKATNPAFEMSLAFLASYRGNLRAACRHYRKAQELRATDLTLSEVREFLDWFQTTGERPAELAFIRGFIEYLFNRDKARAEKRFREFNHLAPKDQYPRERELVRKWLTELEPAENSQRREKQGRAKKTARSGSTPPQL